MDGTTLDEESRLSEKNREALKRAVKAGHQVIITTGRTRSSAVGLLKAHRLDEIGCKYVISYNGGQILDCETQEILFMKTLPLDYIKELMIRARRAGVYLQTYEDEFVLAEEEGESLSQYLKQTNMQARVVPDLTKALTKEPCKMLGIHLHDQSALERFCKENEAWALGKVEMYFSNAHYLEIVPQGVCKGNALKIFCGMFDVPQENTVAVGDENNDISMIQEAGVGCAVANAQDKVKAAADYVTKNDHNHSAVAEVVERFLPGAV